MGHGHTRQGAHDKVDQQFLWQARDQTNSDAGEAEERNNNRRFRRDRAGVGLARHPADLRAAGPFGYYNTNEVVRRKVNSGHLCEG